MDATVPADTRLRERAIAFVSITLLVGLVFLSFFLGFLHEMEVLATASPQLAFEQLNLVGTAALMVTLFSSTALSVLLGYVAFSVYRAKQWPPPGWYLIYTTFARRIDMIWPQSSSRPAHLDPLGAVSASGIEEVAD